MQRAWVALLISSVGCGFSSSNGGVDAGGTGVDAAPDAAVKTSWKYTDTSDGTDWSASTLRAIGGPLNIAADTVIDTDDQTKCIVVEVDVKTDSKIERAEVCALFASSITIKTGVTLSGRGSLPLALFSPTIDVEGTIDVASHVGGQRGAASNVQGCNPDPDPTVGGGGAGGTWTITGGIGGDQGGAPGSGSTFKHAIAAVLLRGGCDGLRGGDGSATGGATGGGGAGGGSVWISTNSAINDGAVTGGALTLGPTSVINASGASGKGGAAGGHGGSGGGSGGLIVLQSATITQDPGTKVFANGGHGGGGSSTAVAGLDATDPTSPKSTGTGGDGGEDGGRGGLGYPGSGTNLDGANGGSTSGGGGGGGGGGVVRADTTSLLGNNSFSPNPKLVND